MHPFTEARLLLLSKVRAPVLASHSIPISDSFPADSGRFRAVDDCRRGWIPLAHSVRSDFGSGRRASGGMAGCRTGGLRWDQVQPGYAGASSLPMHQGKSRRIGQGDDSIWRRNQGDGPVRHSQRRFGLGAGEAMANRKEYPRGAGIRRSGRSLGEALRCRNFRPRRII